MKRELLTLLLATSGLLAGNASDASKRVEEANQVFQEIMAAPDKGIPQDLLDKAHCVVIVPGLKQGGFIVGAKYGKGVMACRKAAGGWRGPAAIRVEGGSVGFQIGVGEVDTVLLIMNERGAEKIMKSEFKLGGEAAAMAGPVGRSGTAETDALMHAEILGYSRSRGAFAGVAISGSTLREDIDDNEALYGRRLTNVQILSEGTGKPVASGKSLMATLAKYSVWEKK
jgi:SH3 domain-containing YSC84-like protein 1